MAQNIRILFKEPLKSLIDLFFYENPRLVSDATLDSCECYL